MSDFVDRGDYIVEDGIAKIHINRKDLTDENYVAAVHDFIKLCKEKSIKVCVGVSCDPKSNADDADYVYSKKELGSLIKINNAVAKCGQGSWMKIRETIGYLFKFDDFQKDGWALEDVIKANDSIDGIVSYIKEKNFSPFESMLFIHAYVTSHFSYNEGDLEECRVIPGVFKDKKIVCSGYASLIKAVIDRLDDENLKCDILGCDLYKKGMFDKKPTRVSEEKLEGGHCHNLVKIKDDKYGIDGFYIEDACWDSKNEEIPRFAKGKGFAHCLYPVADLKSMNGLIYVHTFKEDRTSSLLFDTQAAVAGIKEISEFMSEMKKATQDPNYKMKKIKPKQIEIKNEVFDKYNEQSSPITIANFEKGLSSIYQSACEGDDVRVKNALQTAIENSALMAKKVFGSKAQSVFVKQKVKVKVKKNSSLADNDTCATI